MYPGWCFLASGGGMSYCRPFYTARQNHSNRSLNVSWLFLRAVSACGFLIFSQATDYEKGFFRSGILLQKTLSKSLTEAAGSGLMATSDSTAVLIQMAN
jgi:hypothetical protein